MKSRATPRFWSAYSGLPEEVRELAKKAYKHFRDDPSHPGLQFKKIHTGGSAYSIRVTVGYRALGFLQGGEIVWFWIGTHAGYDRIVDSL